MSSRLIFFSSGLTTTVFQSVLNSPWVSDTFTILVISGASLSRSFLNIVVGIGSSSQDLDLSEWMVLMTCCSIIGAKHLRLGESFLSVVKWSLSLSLSLIFCILFWKKVVNSSARSWSLFAYGNFISHCLDVRFVMRACIFLESLPQS